jgi:hypothetical protein
MISKTWKFKRIFGCISDTHVGSKFALWPPNFVDITGGSISQNPGQEALWEEWIETARFFDKFGVDTILHAGDAMDGQNHKEAGHNLMTPTMNDQIKAAYTTLRVICPEDSGRSFHMVGGSGYHQGMGKAIFPEETLTEKLGGKYHGPVALLRPEGVDRLLLLTHGVSGAYVYKTMIMSRELLFTAESEAIGKIEDHIDIRIQGHWHQSVAVHQRRQHSIQLPCWKVWDGSKIAQKSYGKMQPDIGAGVLMLDSEDRFRYIPRVVDRNPRILDFVKEF